MKPLLILDCDEVILEFARPFARWLRDSREVELKFDSFALVGNMRHLKDGSAVDKAEFPGLLDGFFAEGQHLQDPAEDAIRALTGLRRHMDLVVLTNIPAAFRDIRLERLKALGLDVPVHANDGPKGRRVKELAGERRAVFVDDLPPHHRSAAQHAPEVGRLHMVADAALGGLIPAAPDAHARIDRWADAEPWIMNWMEGQTDGR
ncbi:HAD family hydrolase [Sandaracinobacter sp. RS1-74]|uniref:HAD family hydrolase n=1 Tax=Sandaracinobacteroides sayramensis TaxID=2913411 RepID=UPI001EDB0B45|nr:HAD family hydrolase [Sandaracinobacteroides sayramensis]MCG2840603.1 HAD family hydrolase [Sandaracinobacteroides sayramensis]